MSGGVDSAVAASILKRDAHELVGVTFLFDGGQASRIGAETAASICAKLGISHQVVDLSQRYEELVAAKVLEDLAVGREPSIPVIATSKLLMPALFEMAKELKLRFVATGHYARVASEASTTDAYPLRLMRASDKFFDQSFLLHDLAQDQLNRLMFPLAGMHEMDVRVAAMREGLMMPQVPAGDNPYLFGGGPGLHQWLAQRGAAPAGGEVVELSSGKVLGTHRGLHMHPLGSKVPFGEGGPRYAVAKDAAHGKLYVGSETQAAGETCQVKELVWTSIHPLKEKRSCRVRLERGANPMPVQLVPCGEDRLTMSFTLPIAGLASGKTVVFYSDDMVLGGGVIA